MKKKVKVIIQLVIILGIGFASLWVVSLFTKDFERGYFEGYEQGLKEAEGFTYTIKTECIPQLFCEEIINKYCSLKNIEARKEGERGYYGTDCIDWHLEKQFKQLLK